ncbi:MAG: DUF4476 domain-containing protein [Bacteroidota bacterium]
MRNILIVILSLFVLSVQAQVKKNCYTPISNYQFQQKYNSIVAKKNEAQKLASAKSIAKKNCLSSEQVKKIAALFENDFNRLEFAEIAYLNTTDKSNFYEVYDAFAYFSTVFRLHDYIKGQYKIITPKDDYVLTTLTFPDYNYPKHSDYKGHRGCSSVISDQVFIGQAQKIANANSDKVKLPLAKKNVTYYCLTTAQVMKITSLLSIESNRLTLAKLAYKRVYDKGNYNYMTQLFNNEFNRRELLKYINSSPYVVIKVDCKVTDKDLADIKAQIKKQSFSNTKMTLAKQVIKAKKCFTTDQIIEILKLFSYDSLKIDLAKYSYDYVTDKENYYKTADLLRYEFDKQSLLEYYKNK